MSHLTIKNHYYFFLVALNLLYIDLYIYIYNGGLAKENNGFHAKIAKRTSFW
jgi:hypothetical protein